MIQLINITKKYKNNLIFKDYSVNLHKGDFVSIYGESGSGKSTLLNIIGLLDNFDSGRIDIDEAKDIKLNSKEAKIVRREKVSYLFQSYALVDEMTVLENLNIALEYKNLTKKDKINQIKSVLDELNMTDKMNNYVYELSGGEQQRIAMARVLLHDTPIILADEPTGSLDDKNKEVIINLLKKESSKGKTIIIATHDKDIEAISDKVIYLEKNRYVK